MWKLSVALIGFLRKIPDCQLTDQVPEQNHFDHCENVYHVKAASMQSFLDLPEVCHAHSLTDEVRW